MVYSEVQALEKLAEQILVSKWAFKGEKMKMQREPGMDWVHIEKEGEVGENERCVVYRDAAAVALPLHSALPSNSATMYECSGWACEC